MLMEKLLGGISEDGEYKPRSIALFYKTFFGWSLENIFSYLQHKSEDIDVNIVTAIKKSNFIEFVEETSRICNSILKSAYENELIESPFITERPLEIEKLFASDLQII